MAIPDGKPATDFSAMNREWVRAVAAEAGGLPEVSGSDNGKVMTVVSGEWEAATPAASGIPAPANPSDGDVLTYDGTTSAWVAEAPSGGDVFITEYVIDDNDGLVSASHTLAEISTAYKSGKIPCAAFVFEGDTSPAFYMQFTGHSEDGEGNIVNFSYSYFNLAVSYIALEEIQVTTMDHSISSETETVTIGYGTIAITEST